MARGEVVVEADVLAALRSGALASYAADVFEREPLPHDDPILADDIQDRVSITPHVGAATLEAQRRVALDIAANVLAALDGKSPPDGLVVAPAWLKDERY